MLSQKENLQGKTALSPLIPLTNIRWRYFYKRFEVGALMTDVFDKCMHVVPIKSKQERHYTKEIWRYLERGENAQVRDWPSDGKREEPGRVARNVWNAALGVKEIASTAAAFSASQRWM